MHKKNMYKVIVVFAVALAFVLPGTAAFANVGTIGVTSNSGNTASIKNMVETTNADTKETAKTTVSNSDNTGITGDIPALADTEYMLEGETNTDAERRIDKVFVKVTGEVTPEQEVPQEVSTVYREGNNGEAEPYVPPTDRFGDVDLADERTQVIPTGITIYVDDDNTAGPWAGTQQYPYQYIWQGIENATAGDTVYVLNGTYYENVIVDKAIQLIGESKENTIIDAQNYATVVVITADNVVMKNFQVKDGGEEWAPNRDAGVQILGNYVTFENCELYENFYCIFVISWYSTIINCTTHDNEYGLFLWYTDSKYCRYNQIINILSYDDIGDGVYSSNARNNTHINCVSYSGIYGYYGTGNTYINCHSIGSSFSITANPSYNTIINCSASHASYPESYGSWLHTTTHSTFVNFTIYGVSKGGLNSDYTGIGMDMYTSTDNTFTNCHFYNNDNDGIEMESGSSWNVFTNCEFYNNGKSGISNSRIGYDPASINNVFTNCASYNNSGYAILLNNGKLTTLTGCTFADSHWGVVLIKSANCVLSGNSINNNDINFDVQGVIADYTQNIGPTNTINSKPIFYLISQVNKTLSNVGFLGLIGCTNVSVSDSDMNGAIIVNSKRVNLTNVDSHGGGNALFCTNVDGINLTNSEFYDCNFGVQFLYSSKVKMRNIHIYNNTFNFKIDNDDVNDFYTYDMDTSNTIQGKTIFYVSNISDMTVEEDIGFLGLISCHNVTVEEQNIPGAIIINSNEITLADTLIHDAAVGVYLFATSYTTITNCTIHNAAYGIYLINSHHNTITECTIYNDIYAVNTFGIRGNGASHNNSISNCDIANYYIAQRWQDQAKNNHVTDTVIHGGCYIGFYVRDTAAINNHWYNCEAYGNSYGFYFSSYGSYATIENSSFHDNRVVGGAQYQAGIYGGWDFYNTIINCTIYNNYNHGICITTGHHDQVINCDVYNNGNGASSSGIKLECQNPVVLGYHSLTGNTVHNNIGMGIQIAGTVEKPVTMRNNSMNNNAINFAGFYPNCDIDTSNTVNGKPIYYLYQKQNIALDETDNVGWIGLSSCSNITVLNSEPEGAFVINSFDCTFENVTRHGGSGFDIVSSTTIDFIDCAVLDIVGNGFRFYNGPECKIINCEMANLTVGLYAYFSSGLEIKNCTVHNNKQQGLYLYHSSSGSEIANNSIYTNGLYGIYLKYNSACHLYHNNFVNNTPYNAYDINPSTWDDGYPSGGNFWDDYTGTDIFQGPGQNISGSDGIGDTPYTNIAGGSGNQDDYPLMNPTKDDIPPVTTAILTGAYIGSWYVSNVQITLTAVDYTGVDATYYKVDGGSWVEYTAPVVVSADGPHKVYYYSVDVLGNTEYARNKTFTIDQTPPNAPTLVSPLGDIEKLKPLFDWGNVTDVCGISEYRLKVATDFNFVNTVINKTGLTSSSYQTISTLLVPQTYYWEVRAVDVLGRLGDWSIIGVFNTVEDATPPTAPTPIAPLNGSELESSQPFFNWTDSYDAGDVDHYTLQVAHDHLFSNIVFSVDVNVSQYQVPPDDWLSSGQYYWHARATDVAENVGNWSDVWTFTILTDGTPPVTTHSFSGTMGSNGWYVSNVNVMLSATDAGSGVESTWYKLDGSPWQEYTNTFTVTTNGVHTLLYNSTDKAGNIETTKTVVLKIDQTPPVTTAVLDPLTPNGENGWYISSVEVTLSATDEGSGVASTWYKVDTGFYQIYSTPFTVTTNGEHIVLFYSYDNAGGQETEKSVTFKIDQTPSTTTVKFTAEAGDNNWFISDVEVKLTAADTTSGVAETRYKLDEGSWTTYSAPFIITEEGVHTLYYQSVDSAGNEENEKAAEVKIDKTAPTLEVTTPVDGGFYFFGIKILSGLKTTRIIGPITVVAEASDNVSNITRVEFTFGTAPDHVDDGSPYEWELNTKRVGLYTLTTTAFDNAGLSTATTQDMRIFCLGILGGE
ncbi:MAG: right-handed parallel beta-helix repeat-containing protein [Thermoplasmata archaeon]|nr:right-handed parallel beta-helix repeat-containing protein [Thermoplasmata archaeon]